PSWHASTASPTRTVRSRTAGATSSRSSWPTGRRQSSDIAKRTTENMHRIRLSTDGGPAAPRDHGGGPERTPKGARNGGQLSCVRRHVRRRELGADRPRRAAASCRMTLTETKRWLVDGVEFAVDPALGLQIRGHFDSVGGSYEVGADGTRIELAVDLTSIDTDNR